MPEYDENYETVGSEDDAGLSRVELHNPAFINPAFIKPLAPQTVLPLTGSNVYGVAQPSKANKPTASLTADDTYNKLSNTRRYSRRKSYDKALDTVGKHEASAPAAPQNCEQFAGCFLVILRRRCDDCRLGFPETNLSHSGSVRNSDGRLSFERVNYSTGNHMHAEVSF